MAGLPAITPMQADEISQPFHREGWVYEEKYDDGWRMLAYKEGSAVRLISRAGKDHSRRFADLTTAIRALPPMTLILDGKVAIFGCRAQACRSPAPAPGTSDGGRSPRPFWRARGAG